MDLTITITVPDAQLVGLIRQALGGATITGTGTVAPQPAPAPTPTGAMPPVEDIDNAWAGYAFRAGQLAGLAVGDVGYFATGIFADEYDEAHGLPSGTTDGDRTRWPMVLAAYVEKVKAAAAKTPKRLASVYPSRAALLADCAGYAYGVMIDGEPAHDGSGPADHFYLWPDGSLHRSKPAAGETPVAVE